MAHYLPAQARQAALASAAIRSGLARQRAADLAPVIAELRAAGATSLRDLAAGLDARNFKTARGAAWDATAVRRVLKQANA